MKLTATKTEYFFKESRLRRRKNSIVRNYINRDATAGRMPGILNVEELASLWHFPVEAVVKAPLIQKAPGRKSEPPMSLPINEEPARETIFEPLFENDKFSTNIEPPEKAKNEALAESKLDEKKNLVDEKFIIEKEPVEKKGAPPSNLPVV
jgi:hypothetical protein